MKKIFILIAIVLILATVLIGGAIIMIARSNKEPVVKDFNIEEYHWEIENFPSEKNVGQVNDVNMAIEKAKKLWIEELGTVNGRSYDPTRGRKETDVFFDDSNDCWLIKGTLPPNTKGSVPCAIIQKNGEVLAVWMD